MLLTKREFDKDWREAAKIALQKELTSCGGTESNSYLLAWAKGWQISAPELRLLLVGLGCRCFWSDSTASERPKKFWSLPG